MRRVCPLCTVREAGVIDPGCLICGGHGYVELGQRAVGYFDPHIVSTAVHLALETRARELHETTQRAQDPAPAIRATIDRMVKAGMIRPKRSAPPTPTGRTGTHPGPAAHIVLRTIGTEPTRTDQLMIRARPYPYEMTDRPGARGHPLFSNNWHPSSLACVLDPVPFDTTTLTQTLTRRKRVHHARVLAASITPRRKP